MHFHFPIEGIADGVRSIIDMWRGEREVSQAILFSDPVAARRDRAWRIVLKIIITAGFLLILAIPVWLLVSAMQMEPRVPDINIQDRVVTKAQRAAARTQSQQPSSPIGNEKSSPPSPPSPLRATPNP